MRTSVPYAVASACLPWRKRTTRITRTMGPLYVMVGVWGAILLCGVGVGVGEGVDVGVSLGVSAVVGVGIRQKSVANLAQERSCQHPAPGAHQPNGRSC